MFQCEEKNAGDPAKSTIEQNQNIKPIFTHNENVTMLSFSYIILFKISLTIIILPINNIKLLLKIITDLYLL